MKCLNIFKKMTEKDWLQYEYQVINYHMIKFNHKIWHTSIIPEDELFNSGFITSYNKYRLTRIARNREACGKLVKFSDYGMDFLALDENGKYHAGQAKYYSNKNVSANDLGTFLSVVYIIELMNFHIYIQQQI